MSLIIIYEGEDNPFKKLGDQIHELEEQNHFIIQKLENMALTLADVQAKTASLIDTVAAEDTVIDSAMVLIQGNVTTLADIKAQLAAAIAANDPTALQAVADGIDHTIADVTAKKDALAAAVVAGTPAATGAAQTTQ